MRDLVGPPLRWWGARTVRERRMLILLGVLFVATAVWLGGVRPALYWRAEAADRRERAAASLSQVRQDLARLESAAGGGGATSPDSVEPLVRRTADAAGLPVALAMGRDGHLEFRLPAAASGAALDWVASLERDHRLQLCSIGVVENADATVSVEGTLTSGTCAAIAPVQ